MPTAARKLLREPNSCRRRGNGWINLHFSDLPRWRGAAPVTQRALMAGEQELGVTVFRLVEALDAGDVLTRDSTSFAQGTSAGQALTELASTGTDALLAAGRDWLAALTVKAGEPQVGEDTYAHKLTREDGLISFGSGTTADAALAHWAASPRSPARTRCSAAPAR